ncbi:hypothetical protein CP533_1411 [Ophiocordyceps camponoti-saundersi (nom. inval.)]|nr:hypothetical protein CP533_1411 [Ophiocordyceps camponoti-saundersi (nom. inval.)]
MSVPESCTVLVIGGGPAGSFAASALARDGVDVVVLEADTFPRTGAHFCSTMTIPKPVSPNSSTRNLANEVETHIQPDTDFLAAGGPEGYAWNLVRSESDEMLFRHAGASGAHIFDSIKVDAIELTPLPHIRQLLSKAELVTDIRSASDWSYSSSTYAIPYARIAGDAGCFIDPYFSTGFHISAMGGLSAAATIAASLKGDCDEKTAASWHSEKISESYTAIFLVVSTVMKQIRSREKPVIRENGEKGFDKAFDVFRPGTTDGNQASRPSQSEMTDFIQYCLMAFMFNIDDFMLTPVDGMTVNMERGRLGLKMDEGVGF